MKKLNKQQLIFLAIGFVFAFVMIEWVIVPTINYKNKTTREINKHELRLQELLELEARLKSVRSAASSIVNQARRGENFTLFAFLEQLAGREGLKDNIEFMRPSTKKVSETAQERIVEMRFNDIYITELVPYLFYVEKAPEKVYIKRMTIRKQDKNDAPLNVDLIFSTILSSPV